MILVTKATGAIGRELLGKLLEQGDEVRCIVKDVNDLDDYRADVQIVLGDLLDPFSYRNAFRGVDTVVHLDCPTRERDGHSLEELNGVASWHLAHAAEHAEVDRFIQLSSLQASELSESRYLRARAVADKALATTSLNYTVVATSLGYEPNGGWVKRLEAFAKHVPLIPVPGFGCPRIQPIAAADTADCLAALLKVQEPQLRYELAGPETLSYDQMIQRVLRARGLRRPVLPVTASIPKRLIGTRFVTNEEVVLVQQSLLTDRGTADCELLGVSPRSIENVFADAL